MVAGGTGLAPRRQLTGSGFELAVGRISITPSAPIE